MSGANTWAVWLGGAVVIGAFLASRKALGYVNGQPVELQLGPIGGGLYLREDAARAFRTMAAAAINDGVSLRPSGPRSAFRTPEQQASLDSAPETAALAAPPGYSVHQAGIAVDLETASGTNDAYRWLVKYANTYGFRQRYAHEPWHWEYFA